MSIQADAGTSSAANNTARALSRTRVFATSVRRELWEHRSVWIAPFAAAGFVLFGFSLSLLRPPHTLSKISKLPPATQSAFHMIPFGVAAGTIILTTAIVAVAYCLGTLYNERRDRSILFWKSMPVSDATTVLAKAAIPMLVLPIVGFLVVCVTQLVMLGLDLASWAARGQDPALLSSSIPLVRIWLLLLYAIIAGALWSAPIYAWLFVLSAWAKRGPFLWAVLPPLAICVVEKLAFDTSWFLDFLKYRLGGAVHEAFDYFPMHKGMNFRLPEADPVKFFSSPGLWLGLLAAVALFALAAWLRRRREPM